VNKKKARAYLLVYALAVLFSLLTSGVLDFAQKPYTYDYSGENAVSLPPDALPQELTTFYYDQLNATEQKIYDGLYAAAAEGKPGIIFSGEEFWLYDGDIMPVIQALTYEHPELFWLRCGCRLISITPLSISFSQYPYWTFVSDKEEKIRELDEAADAVAEMARACENHYERIKFVHDYLSANAMYDHDALAETKKSVYDPVHYYIYSAYGCLVNGRTVCAGYAKAFQLIMQKLGYECLYVSGDAGGSHAWNLIFVEDEGYYVDVTWDDPDYDHDEATYEYFCIDDELLCRTHTPGDDFSYPVCDSDTYNYYEINGFLLEEYTYESLCQVLSKQKGKHILTVRFTSEAAYREAKEDLFDGKKKVLSIPAFSGAERVRYTVDNSQYTINFMPEN